MRGWETEVTVEKGGRTVDVKRDASGFHPMVLLNGGTPIASLAVAPRNGQAFITRRSADLMQAVIERDEQTFAFHICNLSNQRIAFDIRRGQDKSGRSQRVNKVNIIQPNSSTTTESDYSNNEREMFLSVLKSTESGAAVTVGADQGEKGTYFSIWIYPTVEGTSFTDAVWQCPDYIACERVAAPVFGWTSNDTFTGGGTGDVFGLNSRRGDRERRYRGDVERGGGGGGFSPYVPGDRLGGGWGSGGGFGFGAPAPQPVAAVATRASPPSVFSGGAAAFMASVSTPTDDDMDDAFATTLSHGNFKAANTRAVECTVLYKQSSKPVSLCLSVLNPAKIHLLPSKASIRGALDCAASYFEGEMMVTKEYPEKECVVCLTEAPQLLFAKCGHKATCVACGEKVDKCPLCRAAILAKIEK